MLLMIIHFRLIQVSRIMVEGQLSSLNISIRIKMNREGMINLVTNRFIGKI